MISTTFIMTVKIQECFFFYQIKYDLRLKRTHYMILKYRFFDNHFWSSDFDEIFFNRENQICLL